MKGKRKTDREMNIQEIAMQEEILCRTVREVMAPLLHSFVLWVLKEAEKSGKKRLYFLARDGYFMYQTAKLLCREKNIPVDCRYVSCSRYSLRIPLFHLNEQEALDYICRRGTAVTLERICSRAGLTDEERKVVLEELKEEAGDGEIIPDKRLTEIRRKLEQSPGFMKYMRQHSREALPGTLAYLEQEGFFDGTSDAVVDSGWVGSVQRTLQQLAAVKGRERKLEGYYFGLYEIPDTGMRALYHCYYFVPECCLRRKVYFNQNLFEVLFSAPHGMTLGYRESGGKYVPCYGNSGKEREDFYYRLFRLLTGEMQRLIKRGKAQRSKILEKRLRKLMCRPGRKEAELLGRLSFSDEAAEGGEGELAPYLTGRELGSEHFTAKLLAAAGVKKYRGKECAWYEGSVIRTGRAVNYHLMQYTMYKYIRHLRKILRNRRKA